MSGSSSAIISNRESIWRPSFVACLVQSMMDSTQPGGDLFLRFFLVLGIIKLNQAWIRSKPTILPMIPPQEVRPRRWHPPQGSFPHLVRSRLHMSPLHLVRRSCHYCISKQKRIVSLSEGDSSRPWPMPCHEARLAGRVQRKESRLNFRVQSNVQLRAIPVGSRPSINWNRCTVTSGKDSFIAGTEMAALGVPRSCKHRFPKIDRCMWLGHRHVHPETRRRSWRMTLQ